MSLASERTDETEDSPVLRIDDVSQADWNYWHQHPGTRLLRKYLRDYAATLKLAVLQRWEQDALELATEHEVRSRIKQLGEIEKLSFENIAEFYETPKEELTKV